MTSQAELAPAYYRLAVGARVWALLVLGVSTASLGDRTSAIGLAQLGLVWSVTTVAEWRNQRWLMASPVEAVIVTTIAAQTVDATPSLLLALAIPPFTAGLLRGVSGVATTLAAELVVMVAVLVSMFGQLRVDQASSTLTWAMTGAGLGLIASYVHAAVLSRPPDPLAPYRAAQALIRELLDLSGDLRSGLDPVSLASKMSVEVRNVLPVEAVAVHVLRGDQLAPLVAGAISSRVDQSFLQPLSEHAWRTQSPQVDGERFALPLHGDGEAVAVVSGMLAAGRNEQTLGVEGRLSELRSALYGLTVQLDTAMHFARLRDAATADERRRLARDLHDGVAQDIAALGYLVDALAAAPATTAQAVGLGRLRERISDVVAQVRLSVQTLRTDVEASESLGAAVSGLARHLSESSGIPIRVTVNERTARLRPEVEAELMRIAQEAMTNAVRHSDATAIDVNCRVSAQSAEILVCDDGRGLGPPREDSYGLKIMRERAELIDADLTIGAAEPNGTVVTVRVPSRRASHADEPQPERVTA